MTNEYLLDANILIYFAHFAAHAYHKNFWLNLEKQIREGNLIVIESIAKECKMPSGLAKWIQNLGKQKLIKAVDEQVLDKASDINKKYKMITKVLGSVKSVADTHLIAYAKINSLAILSYESKRRSKSQPHKIPDVCAKLQIPCQRYPTPVMKELNFGECS